MEIGLLFRNWRRRLALLFAMVASATFAVTIVWASPVQYTATGEVLVPASASGSIGSVGLYVANFTEAAKSSPVTGSIAQELGTSSTTVADAAEVSQIGNSSAIALSYTASSEAVAKKGVDLLGTKTQLVLAGQDLARAQYDVEKFRAQYDATLARRASFGASSNTNQSNHEKEALSRSIGEILEAQNAATARVAAAQSVIDNGSIALTPSNISVSKHGKFERMFQAGVLGAGLAAGIITLLFAFLDRRLFAAKKPYEANRYADVSKSSTTSNSQTSDLVTQ